MTLEGGAESGMTWLEFVSAMVGHLAWPLAAVCLAAMFYRPIRAVITKVSEFEGLGFKASFREDVETLAVETGLLVADGDRPMRADASAPLRESNAHLAVSGLEQGEAWAAMISAQPRAAVISAWLDIEKAVREALAAVGMNPNISIPRALSVLDSHDAISPSTRELVDNARQLRNRAMHLPDNDIQLSEAALFVSSARSIANAVRLDASRSPAVATQISPENP